MAANTRIRIEPDIENYLRSHSERVLGISADKATASDLTTLTNRIIYEHKLAHQMMRQEFIPRILNWLKAALPGSSKIVPIAPAAGAARLEADDRDFLTDFASQFNDEDAA